MRRTAPIDAIANATATAPATTRSVRSEIETSTSGRPASVSSEDDSAADCRE